jgi:hypothetical protein
MWPDIEYEEMLPPVYKRTPGRPKKLRRRGADEPRPGKWSRRIRGGGPTNRCTTCNQEGHNAKSCKSDTIDPEAAKRKVITTTSNIIIIYYVFYLSVTYISDFICVNVY